MQILYFPPFIFTVSTIKWHFKILLEGGDMRLKISLLKEPKHILLIFINLIVITLL